MVIFTGIFKEQILTWSKARYQIRILPAEIFPVLSSGCLMIYF